MMVELYRHFEHPLTHKMLYRWQELLMSGRRDLQDIGQYRMGEEPMQIVSGPMHAPKVHFEAPPSGSVKAQMKQFIAWFNEFCSHWRSSTAGAHTSEHRASFISSPSIRLKTVMAALVGLCRNGAVAGIGHAYIACTVTNYSVKGQGVLPHVGAEQQT